MDEILLLTFKGFTFAKWLFVVSVMTLMTTFVSLILIFTLQLFMSRKRAQTLLRWQNTLGMIFIICIAYIIVAYIISVYTGIPIR